MANNGVMASAKQRRDQHAAAARAARGVKTARHLALRWRQRKQTAWRRGVAAARNGGRAAA
jgi:hypothetical protein